MVEEWIYLTPEERAEQQKIKNRIFRELLDEIKFDVGPSMTCDIKDLIPGYVPTETEE